MLKKNSMRILFAICMMAMLSMSVIISTASAQVDCGSLPTREERLKCWDPAYHEGGAEGWLNALGITGIVTHDARQPDEVVLPPQTVRGVQVTVENMVVKWPYACITTDARERFETLEDGVVYEIPGTEPIVFMATNIVANGEISVWADCTDWEEFGVLLGEDPAEVEPTGNTPEGLESGSEAGLPSIDFDWIVGMQRGMYSRVVLTTFLFYVLAIVAVVYTTTSFWGLGWFRGLLSGVMILFAVYLFGWITIPFAFLLTFVYNQEWHFKLWEKIRPKKKTAIETTKKAK